MAVIVATNGNDTLSGTTSNDSIFSLLGNDILNGREGNDILDGDEGDDILYGGLEHLTDDDILNGGTGNDTLYGGAGNDTYIVDSTLDKVAEDFGAGDFDTILSSVSFTLGSYVEELTLTGTAATKGTGNASDNSIYGNEGNNSLYGRDGDDDLYGGVGFDYLVGGNGNDSLNGGVGVGDTLNGGNGNDSYNVSDTKDIITENLNGGADTVYSSITWTLGANLENLTMSDSANDGNGNSLNNKIISLSYDVSINNTLSGYGGNDTLIDNFGNDRLIGGSGNDILAGGAGNDTLIGSTGNDKFLPRFNIDAAFSVSAVGVDTINDFNLGVDKIVLNKTLFTALTSVPDNGFSVQGELATVGSNAAAASSSAFIVYSSATGNLFYNQNGKEAGFGTGVQFATLSGIPSISATDFIIEA